MSKKIHVVTVFNKDEFRLDMLTYDQQAAWDRVAQLHEENPYYETGKVVGLSSHNLSTGDD